MVTIGVSISYPISAVRTVLLLVDLGLGIDLGSANPPPTLTSTIMRKNIKLTLVQLLWDDSSFTVPLLSVCSPRRGSGPQQRAHRGQTAGSEFMGERVQGLHGSRAFTPLTPRGRARRGRPPSRSPLSR